MKSLIIAEKPSLDRTIQKALYFENWKNREEYAEGNNYVSTHAFGHLFELYSIDDYLERDKTSWSLEELPFIPKQFKYKIKEDKSGNKGSSIKKQLGVIEKLILRKDINEIIVAGDSDAEGQNLVQSIVEYVFNRNKIKKEVMRLWFSDQSEPSIREDIKHLKPNEEYQNYYNQADARAKADWLLGINYSRAISLLCSDDKNKTVFISGRVIACIVEKIYERFKEQERFVPEKYFNIQLNLEDYKLSVIMKGMTFKEIEQLQALETLNKLNSSNTYIKEIKRKKVKKEPKHLFSLTTLQNKANKLYKFSSSLTLKVVQMLYEKGYVSYPRTDSEYLSENDKGNVKNIIEKFKEIGVEQIAFKDSKSVFNSKKALVHSALIPTSKMLNAELTENEKLIYSLIKNRFLSNFCDVDCIVEETKVVIGNSNTKDIAEINGLRVINKGFLNFENVLKDKSLPGFKEGEHLKSKYTINDCITKPPTNITLKELNNWMQSPFSKQDESEDEKYVKILAGLQIGTPATRADIIEKAKKVNYIVEDKGVYTITKKGKYFCENTKRLGLLITSKQTATLGAYLQKVLEDKITVEQCVNAVVKNIVKNVKDAKEIKVDPYIEEQKSEVEIGKCPKCGKRILEGPKSFYCEGFKNHTCDFTLFKKDKFLVIRGKTLTKSIVKKLLKDGQAKVSGLKSKDLKTYDAVITYKKNDKYYNIIFENKENIQVDVLGKCPRCNSNIIESRLSYTCENKECSYILWKDNKFLKDKNIKLSKSQMKKLIAGKKLIVKNIKRKDGKGHYDAELFLEDTGKYVNYKFNII